MKRAICALIAAIFLLGLYTPVNAAETKNYEGKIISILGDSISTFQGYIPEADGVNLRHFYTYPSERLLDDANETWWMQVINQLGGQLGVNESWSGTRFSNYSSRNEQKVGKDVCMSSITRIKNLGSNGTPDVILVYGGTNDVGNRVDLGVFKPEKAPTEVDLDAIMWDDFCKAFTAAIMRLQHFYPDAEIYIMLPTHTEYFGEANFTPYLNVMQEVCDHYGIETIDLRKSGINLNHLPDGVHPNEDGMDLITDEVIKNMMHTHSYTIAEETGHSCECGKKADHALSTTSGLLGSTTTTCSVCTYSTTNSQPMILWLGGTAAVVIAVAIILIVGNKKKKDLP